MPAQAPAKTLAGQGTAGNEVRVTDDDRLDTLRKFSSDLNRSTPARQAEPGESAIDWEEIAFLAEGLAFGPRALRAATDTVTQRHDLGPRGAWILNVISHGIAYPLELASVFCVGRSLITAELTRLSDAGLIATRPGREDRRRTELTLTPLGQQACVEIREDLSQIVRRRLAGFSPEEVRLTAEVLRALGGEPGEPHEE